MIQEGGWWSFVSNILQILVLIRGGGVVLTLVKHPNTISRESRSSPQNSQEYNTTTNTILSPIRKPSLQNDVFWNPLTLESHNARSVESSAPYFTNDISYSSIELGMDLSNESMCISRFYYLYRWN